jgi:hypothetical protein
MALASSGLAFARARAARVFGARAGVAVGVPERFIPLGLDGI